MENRNCYKKLYAFQAADLTNKEIKEGFIVRKHEYQLVISEIKRDRMEASIQHYILVGSRGSGKSTILRRIRAEVETDSALNKRLTVIYLAEEQAGIYKLHDLCDLIIRGLITETDPNNEPPDWTDYKDDMLEYTRQLYFYIQGILKRQKRKLILLLDNIDRIFDSIGDEAHLLREWLINYKDWRIIGGSTRMHEHYWKYEMPFYQFFRIVKLNSLTGEEVRELLTYWSKCLNKPELEQFIRQNPGKLDTIRVLTDGMPRTLLYFVELLLDRSEQKGFEYLRSIMDKATGIYQERLNKLPPAQRKIVLELSFFWEAVKVNKLITVCKMPGSVVSAQLNQLVKNEIVEKIKTSTKDNLYRLQERFFNLWLLMTQGNPEAKRSVRYLTVFLENFYGREELQKIYLNHLEELETGLVKPAYAAMMSMALAHSRSLSVEQKDDLIDRTFSIQQQLNEELVSYLPEKSVQVFNLVIKLIEKKQYETARNSLEKIEQDSPDVQFLKGLTFQLDTKPDYAEKYYLMAIDKGHASAMYNLAFLYEDQDKPDKAEKYYLMAIDKGHASAMYNLAFLYYDLNKEKKVALELIDRVLDSRYNSKTMTFKSILLIWNGDMKGFHRNFNRTMPELIENHELSLLQLFLSETLVHQQYNLVYEWFQSEKYGKKLKEMLLPLYFVTAGFVKTKTAREEILKPGEELLESIEKIKAYIRKRQNIYYS